ncbi:hypothetical protein [Sphingomonas echinoides]|uniref:hypothetical protein n=1 Tax=Sphingomonas echinoides TaxID=59803 RepID=UPI002412EC45|nr:hypothetical protein [Sphingomonas echinoides]
MIIKVTRGNSADGLLVYQRRLDRTPAEQAGVRLFDMHGIYNMANAAAVLDRAAARSGRKNPIVHIIIRAERGLSDPELRIAMMAALEEAGLATNAWIAFRHDNDDDDPGDHMHIAGVAADLEGNPPPRFLRSVSLERKVTTEEAAGLPSGDARSRAWDSQLRRRLMATARHLEDDFDLRPLARDRATLNRPVRDTARVSRGAVDREQRTGIPALADLLDTPATQAALDEPDYTARATALAKLDLELRPFLRKNGDMAGLRLYRISDPNLHCPVSALGGAFSHKALDRRSPVSFADWYQHHTPAAETAPAPAIDKPASLRSRYAEYTRQVAAQQIRLREERIEVIAWRKRERAKALARRKAAAPMAGTRSARVHRAAAVASYRLECQQIDREARGQHAALDDRRVRRLDYINWLAGEAKTDPEAARKLAAFRTREAKTPLAPIPAVSTAPMPIQHAAPMPLSPAEKAVLVAEQERLMRAADEFSADGAVLSRHSDIEALAARLDAIGVKMIVDADRQDRRVRVKRDAVQIDGVTMTAKPKRARASSVLTQAKLTEQAQLGEERDLPIAIHSVQGIAPRAGETPASLVDRFYQERRLTRWMTPMQDVAIRNEWAASNAELVRQSTPPASTSAPDMTFDRPAMPPSPPPGMPVEAHCAIIPSTTPQTALLADGRSVVPEAIAAKQYAHVDDAMAIINAQRPVTTPARPATSPAKDAATASPEHTPSLIPHVTQPARVAASPQAAKPIVATSPAPPGIMPPVQVHVSVHAARPVDTRNTQDAHLIARWLVATEAASADPTCRRESETLAARLVARDQLGILDAEMQAQAVREADAYRARLAEEAQEAERRQKELLALPTPTPPFARTPAGPASSLADGPAKPTKPRRPARLQHIGKISDPWQRS